MPLNDERSAELASEFKINIQRNNLLVTEIVRDLKDLAKSISHEEYRGCLAEVVSSQKLSVAQKADLINSISDTIYSGYKQGIYGELPHMVRDSNGSLSEAKEFIDHLNDDDFKIFACRGYYDMIVNNLESFNKMINSNILSDYPLLKSGKSDPVQEISFIIDRLVPDVSVDEIVDSIKNSRLGNNEKNYLLNELQRDHPTQ